MMNTSGIPATRWFDAAMLPKDQVEQKDNVKAMMVLGHSPNTFTRIPVAARGLEKLDLLVVGDPHPTQWAVLGERKNGTYLLPICTQYETRGTRTASNGSLQAYQQIVKPLFESKSDGEILYLLAKKLGFADQMFKNIKVENGQPLADDVLSEINRGGWSTGYCGQSPERLKAHLRNQAKFDPVTLRAPKDDPEVGGDYYGLPWPCWGTPELKHPGTPILYNTNLHVMEGGGTFRARFGVEREVKLPDGTTRKDNLLAEGLLLGRLGDQGRISGVHLRGAQEARLGQGPHDAEELAVIESIGGTNPDAVSWSTDLSGGIQRVAMAHGCIPYGNAKARAIAWNLPDPIPVHREPIYTPRPDLVAKYPTLPNAVQFRVPNLGFDVQKAAVEKGIAKQFPLILTSGRLVEYEGGGEETRSNKWLAELQQDMFIEINPADAAERGIKERRLGAGDGTRDGERQGLPHEGAGHRAGRQGRHLDAVPLRRLVPGRRSARQVPAGHRPDRAGRERQHDHDLRLRSGDRHAGAQGHALPGQGGLRRIDNGSDEISLRRRPLHRVQRLRHRLQERARCPVGHQSAARRHHQ